MKEVFIHPDFEWSELGFDKDVEEGSGLANWKDIAVLLLEYGKLEQEMDKRDLIEEWYPPSWVSYTNFFNKFNNN